MNLTMKYGCEEELRSADISNSFRHGTKIYNKQQDTAEMIPVLHQ
jgi:hypothetical protein